MERNREGRRASLVAAPNGLSRRRHRPNSLRDSPDEDGPAEFSESVRLRERVKKDRDRDRERDRERERSSRSKRRRGGDRLIHGSDRGDDSSAESNYDEECEDDDGNHQHQSNGGGGARSLPPNPLTAAAAASFPNHHHPSSNTINHHQQNHLQHRKTYPPNSTNVLRTSPVWKSGDEMIGGISVPRKARSAHTKRSHDWVSCNSGAAAASNGGAAGGDQNHRQASTSPVRHGHALSPAHPLSPTSSNASGRKKIKVNNGTKQRPPKSSSSKSTSSNREELEIEIAEVLYGLMTQSQAPPPPKKEVAATNDSREVANNRSGGGCGGDAADSNTQSPAILPMSSTSPSAPFSAIAPKRKRPRQVLEPQSSPSIRSSPSSASTKSQIDQTMAMKAEASSPNSEKTAVENNGGSLYSYASQGKTLSLDPVPESMAVVKSETRPAAGELSSREDQGGVGKVEEATILPNKESAVAVTAEDNNRDDSTSTVPAATTYKPSDRSEAENHTEKIQIDLMLRPSSEGEGEGEVNFCSTTVDHKRGASNSINPEMKLDDGELGKIDAQSVEAEEKKGSAEVEVVSDKKIVDAKGRDIDLQLDLEKREWDSGSAINRSQQPTQKQPPSLPPPSARTNKEQSNMVVEKSSQSGSLPLPMSMASWSGGLPPLGYMAPLQGVLAMDGSTIPSTPLQPVFTQPRPKRCATHCYIARNIHLLQQFMKMNPFWPPAPTPSSLFGSNACNLNVVPATEFNANIVGRGGSTGGLDKGPGLAIFPGFGSKDKGSQAPNIPDPVHRKQQQQQQILLQQPLPPPAAPNSLLPGHTYIIPLNQQQAGPRPGASKSPVAATGAQHALSNVTNSAAGGSNASATAAGGTHAAVSFSYPNVPPNETPYLAILQNNGYFQIPAVGAPLNYRGAHPPQPLPLFNGSFYSPQMIHPQQLQQQHHQQQTNSQSKQMQQNTSMSSGSSSSHKHLQNQQKRSQGHAAVNGNNGNGNVHNFPVSKSHTSQSQQHLQSQNIIPPPQARHIENELGGGDSPSTADSRARPPVNAYNQNYMMQIHHSNFGMMATSPATMGVVSAAPTSSSGNQNDKRQQQQHSLKTGLESMMPQNFTMPFAPLSSGASAPGIDMSSVAHNHAIFQSLPEAARQNFQMVAAAAVAASQQKKNHREEVRGGAGSGDPMTAAADERKVLQGKTSPAHPAGFRQSMAFSGSDGTDVSASKMAATTNVMDTSRASMSPAWTARAVMPCSPGSVISNAQLHAQYQQQMVQQLQKQQQQLGTSVNRTKAPTTISNGTAEYLTSSVATGGVKFSNTISAFPQNLVQISGNTSSSPTHSSPQWKASAARASTSQAAQTSSLVSASSSHKNHTQQQQQMRMQQSHTQISFGTNHKSTVQGQHHPPPSSSNQSQSSTMMAGSPTTSSISKGASGSSPRRANSASMSNKNDQAPTMAPQQGGKASVQQIANQKSSSPAGGRSAPLILGNQQHMPTTSGSGSKSQMQQQHLQKSVAQQSQLFFSGSYGQSQSTSTGSASATSGYFAQRRRPEQQQQHPLSSTGPPTSPTGMLNMCPVSLGGGTISNPGKSNAATAAASTNLRGISLPPQQALHAAQFSSQSSGNQHHILPAGFSYVQQHPSAASVKPTEQKQPAGNDSLHACWQLDKG